MNERDEKPRSLPWKRPWVLAALLLAAGVAVYANALPAPFQFDDRYFIVEDESLERLWPPGGRLVTRPVLSFTLALNRAVGGLDPRGYRATNIAIHLAASLLLFGLVRRTLRRPLPGDRFASRADGLAFAVALLWVVHPLSTMAVTYLWQRGESLMGLFFLGFLYSLVRHAEGERRRLWRTLTLLAFLGGVGTKETMVAVVPVALLFDGILLSPSIRAALRRGRRLYGALGVVLLLGAMFVLPRIDTSNATLPPLRYALSQPGIVLDYLRLAFWPDPLCFDYQRPAAYGWATIGFPAALLGAGVLATLRGLRRRSWLGVAGAWVLLTLAPSSSFIPINDLMVEYRMYLPLAGVCALAVGAGSVLGPRLGLPPAALLSIAALALGWTSVRRNRDYLSELALWQSVVQVAPNNMRAHYELGVARFSEGRAGEARESFERAIEVIVSSTAAREAGRPPSGVNCETVQLRDIAGAFVELGQRDAAPGELIGDLERAVELQPDHPRAHALRGVALRRLGRASEALAAFERAIQLEPERASTRINRGLCLLELEQPAEALKTFHRALALEPRHAGALFGRAQAYRGLGREAEARADLRRVLRESTDPRARERAAELLAE
ncbi:MAG: tetratricopeptide repeat protein [Planctomycetota bacterium]|nr:tetratricopeptide repeat protein [Planctomycetota bacterium]